MLRSRGFVHFEGPDDLRDSGLHEQEELPEDEELSLACLAVWEAFEAVWHETCAFCEGCLGIGAVGYAAYEVAAADFALGWVGEDHFWDWNGDVMEMWFSPWPFVPLLRERLQHG